MLQLKKGQTGLGIMIIEGKHAEVGNGIFISDIQEGSIAEQAGLVVGDMILAVNQDELLGADYDTVSPLAFFLFCHHSKFFQYVLVFPM